MNRREATPPNKIYFSICLLAVVGCVLTVSIEPSRRETPAAPTPKASARSKAPATKTPLVAAPTASRTYAPVDPNLPRICFGGDICPVGECCTALPTWVDGQALIAFYGCALATSDADGHRYVWIPDGCSPHGTDTEYRVRLHASRAMALKHEATALRSRVYGDIWPQGGDGLVELEDLICVQERFAGGTDCLGERLHGADVAPCGASGLIDVDDLIAVIAAFGGEAMCK